jgi:membrane associated rhomboid family serine protease
MPIELESRLDLLILAQGAVIGLWTTASFGLARHGASKSALWFGWAGAAWLLVGFSQILLLNHILPMLLEPGPA